MSKLSQISKATADYLLREFAKDLTRIDNTGMENINTKITQPRRADGRSVLPRALAVEAAMRQTG